VAHERGGGGEAFLYIDPSTAGIAGSMLLGGLMDAMAPARRRALLKLLEKSFVRRGFAIDHGEVKRRGFRGFYIDGSNVPLDTQQLAAQTAKAARALSLSPQARELAAAVVQLLVDLEAEVHGVPKGRVHLHELAGYDTVFDAAATARALDDVGFFDAGAVAYARPVEVGSGVTTFSHGTTPVPPPVSELILQRHRIPFTQHADREVATPTGLALLASLRPRFGPPPASTVRSRGVGAGRMELPDRANLLYVQLRERIGGGASRPVHDPVAQLELSLDDVTGETAGHALSRALDEGALDAHLVLTSTKKGRPGHLLLVLTREQDAERIADMLVEETGSWGVRMAHRVARFKAEPQEMVVRFTVGRRAFGARVKFLIQGDRLVRVKAEYDDVAAAARSAGVTLAQARDAAESAARSRLQRRRDLR
jgi:uncharacterized protein (TIGR00299 family) protein